MDAAIAMHDRVFRCQEPRQYERLNGKYVAMSRPKMNHARVAGNVFGFFDRTIDKKYHLFYEPDLFLEDDNVIPDIVVVSDISIIRSNGIYGAPDLVVEILSPSTLKRDKGYKMELYERSGVPEYWLVDPENKAIEIYHLTDGRYRLYNACAVIPEDLLVKMRDDEKAEIVETIASAAFPDLEISLQTLFDRMI